MFNPNPECDKDCRFSYHGGVSTCMGWTPVYDKHGNRVNEDPNTHTSRLSCSTCNKSWTVITKSGKTTVSENMDR